MMKYKYKKLYEVRRSWDYLVTYNKKGEQNCWVKNFKKGDIVNIYLPYSKDIRHRSMIYVNGIKRTYIVSRSAIKDKIDRDVWVPVTIKTSSKIYKLSKEKRGN